MSPTPCPHCGTKHEPQDGSCARRLAVGGMVGSNIRVAAYAGATGTGQLYDAEYLPNRQPAALLVFPPAQPGGSAVPPPLSLDRLRPAIDIRHPNVAAVYEAGESADGCVYVACEQLEGVLLSELLAEEGKLPWRDVLDLFQQAAAGLQAAHESGVIHGNVSPAAVLITSTAGSRRSLKLIGFGMNAAVGGPDRPGAVAAAYASPERLAGQPPDERSDVFSLGAVLHHLVAGAPPGSTAADAIPERARAAIHRALDPLPAQRFRSVQEFADALERSTPALLVAIPHGTGRHGSARHGTGRPARRHGIPVRVAVAAAAVTAAVLWFSRASWVPLGGASTGGDTIEIAEAPRRPSGDSVGDRRAAVLPAQAPPQPPTASPRKARPPEPVRPARVPSAPVRPAPETVAAATPPVPVPGAAAGIGSGTGISRRISLDEANRELGGPLHAIDGMPRRLVGIVPGHMVPEADPSRSVVRAVYGNPEQGRPIFLDQQRVAPGKRSRLNEVPRLGPAGDQRWIVGDVVLVLHGHASPDSLSALARRVR